MLALPNGRHAPFRTFVAVAPWMAVIPALVASASPSFAADHLFVVTTDFVSNGNCAALELTAPWTPSKSLEPVGVQPVPRWFGGLHYVVCGAPDNDLRIIDPATFETIRTLTFDSDSNPRDVLPIGDGTGFVSFYDRDELLRVDLETGETVAVIDLGAFADTDGRPEMDRMIRDGDHVFVQLQRLDRSPAPPPQRNGALAVVSVAANALVDADPDTPGVQAIELSWWMPRGPMQIEGRTLWVSEPGAFQDHAGGIEAVDLDTLEPQGLVYIEKDIGAAHISGFVLVSPSRGFFIHHTDLAQSSHVVSFSRTPPSFLAEHYVSFGLVESYAYDAATGLLYFPDNEPGKEGIRVFDVATGNQLTAMPIATGLRPVECVVARDGATDAPVAARPLALSVRPAPNPTRGATRFLIEAAHPGRYSILVSDIRGRVVRRWDAGIASHRGREAITWDGRDGAGRPVASGVYTVRVSGRDGSSAAERLVLRR